MNDHFNENRELDIQHFEWFLPSPPKPVFTIVVSDEKGISLNSKLCEYIPRQLKIGISQDGKNLGLLEIEEKGYLVLKNGKIKGPELVRSLKTRGIPLPANYIVEQKDDLWLATFVNTNPVSLMPRKTPKKPRKNGLRTMLPKKEND
ncbi:hypothetical protein [Paenibacillus sp. J22TS3]|uniref:hypothetical protein n=1 Tax=Paenibacillus sp. J22TS3 TaxID=2807192 RepID=UPI001B01BE4A|nr:hypothetical protein [Paenibacillus sp. J22TS3]GIP24372.1 hypothetical protein J22TS3_46470 [Paenibacillus sp. J22TS3]